MIIMRVMPRHDSPFGGLGRVRHAGSVLLAGPAYGLDGPFTSGSAPAVAGRKRSAAEGGGDAAQGGRERAGCFQGQQVAGAGDDAQLSVRDVRQQVISKHVWRLDRVVLPGQDRHRDLDRLGGVRDVCRYP